MTAVIALISHNCCSYGSMMFIDKLYETSGNCLTCNVRVCSVDESRYNILEVYRSFK